MKKEYVYPLQGLRPESLPKNSENLVPKPFIKPFPETRGNEPITPKAETPLKRKANLDPDLVQDPMTSELPSKKKPKKDINELEGTPIQGVHLFRASKAIQFSKQKGEMTQTLIENY